MGLEIDTNLLIIKYLPSHFQRVGLQHNNTGNRFAKHPGAGDAVRGRLYQSRLGLHRETVLGETGQEETRLDSWDRLEAMIRVGSEGSIGSFLCCVAGSFSEFGWSKITQPGWLLGVFDQGNRSDLIKMGFSSGLTNSIQGNLWECWSHFGNKIGAIRARSALEKQDC